VTKEDFSKLSPALQESFIEGGGLIEVSQSVAPLDGGFPHSFPPVESPSPVVSVLPTDEHIEKEQPQQVLNSSTAVVDSSTYADGFDIENPVELLFMLDKEIQKGRKNGGVDLHPWQVKFMLDFAEGGSSDKNPFQAIVRACNGSGKDKYIIAPCVVWLCMKHKKAIGVVTSSSGAQLDNQTCRYIKQLCEALNSKLGSQVWNTKYRHYVCDFGTGYEDISEIFCYATDEAGKAEGYHPTAYGAKMGIFVSEDKTVPDEINVALNKCTGYTHRAHVSTPGLPMGHFFNYDATAVPREALDSVKDAKPIDWIRYLVTAYECSHIQPEYIEQMKRDLPGGEFGAAFKSQVLAEFGTTDEMVVVPYIYVSKSINAKIPWIEEPYNTAGLDLSDGGAETVLLIRNGNKHIKTIPFRFDNTEDTLDFLEEQFEREGLKNREALIFADCCGIGKPMINSLKRKGWSNMRYVDSRHKAREPRVYSNLGTELFFNVRKLLENNELIVQRDDLLIRQLSTRYYKINTSNIHALLTKLEQRSRGFPSPDRADAFNLAFWNYKSTKTYEENDDTVLFGEEPKLKVEDVVGDFDEHSWATREMPKFRVENVAKSDLEDLQEELSAYNKQRKQLVNN
jgi:hypothetical protein